MKLLSGKTALVTGASKGIGRAIALKFAEQGANVAFTYLSSVEQGQALEAELAAKGIKAKGYRSDAADFAQAEKLINDVVADFGSLDVLINNAGITMDNSGFFVKAVWLSSASGSVARSKNRYTLQVILFALQIARS